jgi:hypothetical protein
VSLRVVQEIGGWTSLRMLERYAHPTDGEMQKAVRVIVDLTTEPNVESTTGTKTGTAANRAITHDAPETRQRVVGLDDWAGVPDACQLEPDRVLARPGRRTSPLGVNACLDAPSQVRIVGRAGPSRL